MDNILHNIKRLWARRGGRKAPAAHNGYFVVMVLVFSGAFVLVLGSLTGYIFTQNRVQFAKESREVALQIAEAGLNYYKWFLAHYPDDISDGTGGAPGPYVHEYFDPEGGKIGGFSLEIEGNEKCGGITSIDITSTGVAEDDPRFSRVVYGRYARPSVAEFAYIINSNVWAGSDRVIVGPYHSNGGIRMDGTNNSTVTSSVEDWQCTSSFGCSGTETMDGVFGAGAGSALWEFPVPQVDFGGLTIDLLGMKARAQSDGLYFGPSGRQGYRVVFNADGTVTVHRVTRTVRVWGYNAEDGDHRHRPIVRRDALVGTYTIPSDCSVIFVEDDLWIEGEVGAKVTIASANVIHANVDTTIFLSEDITYTTSDGTVGLTAIAEEDVLISLDSPSNMTLHGIFIAQNGRFGRNHYRTSGDYDVPSAWDSYARQNTLTMHGTIVSNGRVGTRWTSGGTFVSGYNERFNTYDRNLAADPPPLTPYTSDDFQFIEWRELEE